MQHIFRVVTVTLFLACGFVVAADDAKKPDSKNEEGFVSLFNGKDLSGWKLKGKFIRGNFRTSASLCFR